MPTDLLALTDLPTRAVLPPAATVVPPAATALPPAAPVDLRVLEVRGLGEAIAEHGLGPSREQLVGLAALARRCGVATAAAAVLVDVDAPDVVRERAFAVVCAALAVLADRPRRAGAPAASSATA